MCGNLFRYQIKHVHARIMNSKGSLTNFSGAYKKCYRHEWVLVLHWVK